MTSPAPVRLALRRAAGVPAGRRCCWRPPTACPGGAEIRRSDAPRLVDLVREAQQSVDRLSAQRDDAGRRQIDTPPRRLAAMTDGGARCDRQRAPALAVDAGLVPMRGPGLVVTLNDAQRDANGRFPRDASPDDLVVHQQDIQAVLNALWSARRRRRSRCRTSGSSPPRRRDASATRCCSTAAPTARRTSITAIGDVPRDAGGAGRRAAGHPLQAVRRAVRARLHRSNLVRRPTWSATPSRSRMHLRQARQSEPPPIRVAR